MSKIKIRQWEISNNKKIMPLEYMTREISIIFSDLMISRKIIICDNVSFFYDTPIYRTKVKNLKKKKKKLN